MDVGVVTLEAVRVPVWRDGRLQIVRWGNGRGQSRFLPRSGGSGLESGDALSSNGLLHDEMLAITPPGDAYELHINLIRHGRAICRPRPLCDQCDLRRMCPWFRANRAQAATAGAATKPSAAASR
jgi:hypothetical protein